MKQDQEQVKMLENESDSDSDKSSVVLDENERKLLRKNKIWTRRNIIDIENRERQRKYQEKLIMPYPVIEKIKNLNDYELNCMLEESIRFIEGKCLIFDKNDCERVQLNENIYQNRLFKVKNELNKINNIFMEINYRWEQTNKKDNLLAKREDIDTLKNQSLELIKEKDIMISEMVKELEHLVDESLYETKATSDDLFKLQNIATSKIQLINEEYEKNNSHIAELIEEERNKGNDKDNAEWTLLMDKTMTRITNSTLKRLLLIEKNDYELCRQYENNIENAKIIRLDITEKNMGMDSELEFVKLKCSENIYKIIQNCEILKKRIEDNNFNIEDKKQHFYTLQNFLNNIITEHNAIESDNKNQISIIKKGIININNKINDNEKRADEIAKKFNGVYMKSWNLQQNEIIRYINDILQIDDFVHRYLGLEKTHFPKISNISALPFMKVIIDQILDESLQENFTSNSYESIRNKALNDLIFDFIIKNSSIEFDYNLNKFNETKVNSMQNFPYAFGTLNLYELRSWNILKSKFKPYVTCKNCNSPVNWEFDENIVNLEKHCTISNNSTNELMKSLSDKLSTHITLHNKRIDKIIKSNSSYNLNNKICSNNNYEEQNSTHSTITVAKEECNNHTALDFNPCQNINHQLYLDNKYCMPIMKEIIKENQPKPQSKPKSSPNLTQKSEFMHWKIKELDLREYWSQFSKYIPSKTINFWEILYSNIGNYYNELNERKKKLAVLKKLQIELKNLKNLKHKLENTLSKNDLLTK